MTRFFEAALDGSKTNEMKSESVMLAFFLNFSGICIEEAPCELVFVVVT